MAGIIAVYGLVVSVLIIGGLSPDTPYSLYAGFIHLAAGLSCGLTGLAAGHAIGIVGDAVSSALGGSGGRRDDRMLTLPPSVREGLHVPEQDLRRHGAHARESTCSSRSVDRFCRGGTSGSDWLSSPPSNDGEATRDCTLTPFARPQIFAGSCISAPLSALAG